MPPSRIFRFVRTHEWEEEILALLGVDDRLRTWMVNAPYERDSIAWEAVDWIRSGKLSLGYSGSDKDSVITITNHFINNYNYIAVYHGSKFQLPIKLDDRGLIILSQDELNEFAKHILLEGGFTPQSIDLAIAQFKKDAPAYKRPILFTTLDHRVLLEQNTHYLEMGSEYIQAIASRISVEAKKYLATVLSPTLFEILTVPRDICRHTLVSIGHEILNVLRWRIAPQDFKICEFIDLTIQLNCDVPKDQISAHWHPISSIDPTFKQLRFQITEASCTCCF